ncbi:hypothetical protein GCM10023340_19550 [Nocardioides marinquilinus]|uniref:Uncharacterized protein n=1 Tax=Nocardioides marinquilinus TaxID=1210400 RepID=A0ABP9PIT8_9ACTN
MTYADLRHIHDSHGFRPTGRKPAKSVRLLHEAYAAWERAEHVKPGRGYLMPLHLADGHLRQVVLARTGRMLSRPALRALVVDAFNHPRSGMEILPRPYRQQVA